MASWNRSRLNSHGEKPKFSPFKIAAKPCMKDIPIFDIEDEKRPKKRQVVNFYKETTPNEMKELKIEVEGQKEVESDDGEIKDEPPKEEDILEVNAQQDSDSDYMIIVSDQEKTTVVVVSEEDKNEDGKKHKRHKKKEKKKKKNKKSNNDETKDNGSKKRRKHSKEGRSRSRSTSEIQPQINSAVHHNLKHVEPRVLQPHHSRDRSHDRPRDRSRDRSRDRNRERRVSPLRRRIIRSRSRTPPHRSDGHRSPPRRNPPTGKTPLSREPEERVRIKRDKFRHDRLSAEHSSGDEKPRADSPPLRKKSRPDNAPSSKPTKETEEETPDGKAQKKRAPGVEGKKAVGNERKRKKETVSGAESKRKMSDLREELSVVVLNRKSAQKEPSPKNDSAEVGTQQPGAKSRRIVELRSPDTTSPQASDGKAYDGKSKSQRLVEVKPSGAKTKPARTVEIKTPELKPSKPIRESSDNKSPEMKISQHQSSDVESPRTKTSDVKSTIVKSADTKSPKTLNIKSKKQSDIESPKIKSPETVESTPVESPDVRSPKVKTSEVKSTSSELTDAKSPKVKTPDLEPVPVESSDINSPKIKRLDTKSTKNRTANVKSPKVKLSEAKSTIVESPDVKSPKLKSLEVKSTPSKTANVKSPKVKLSEAKSTIVESPDVKSPKLKTLEVKSTPSKTANVKSPKVKLSEAKSTIVESPDVKSPKLKSLEVKSTPSKTANVKSPKVKLSEAKSTTVESPDVKSPKLKTLEAKSTPSKSTNAKSIKPTSVKSPDIQSPKIKRLESSDSVEVGPQDDMKTSEVENIADIVEDSGRQILSDADELLLSKSPEVNELQEQTPDALTQSPKKNADDSAVPVGVVVPYVMEATNGDAVHSESKEVQKASEDSLVAEKVRKKKKKLKKLNDGKRKKRKVDAKMEMDVERISDDELEALLFKKTNKESRFEDVFHDTVNIETAHEAVRTFGETMSRGETNNNNNDNKVESLEITPVASPNKRGDIYEPEEPTDDTTSPSKVIPPLAPPPFPPIIPGFTPAIPFLANVSDTITHPEDTAEELDCTAGSTSTVHLSDISTRCSNVTSTVGSITREEKIVDFLDRMPGTFDAPDVSGDVGVIASPSPMHTPSDDDDIIEQLHKEFVKAQNKQNASTGGTDNDVYEPIDSFSPVYQPNIDVSSSVHKKKKKRGSRKHKHRKHKADNVIAVDKKDIESALNRVHRQARVEDEMKLALKPYFQHKDITKDEYKTILRKAVPQVTNSNHSIDPERIRSLMKKYVAKYKGQKIHNVDPTENTIYSPTNDQDFTITFSP